MDALVKLIQETVDPTSWREAGGTVGGVRAINGQLVVDNAVMENYYDRSQPVPARGPISLQTHGGEIRWRNVFLREIAADEARRILVR